MCSSISSRITRPSLIRIAEITASNFLGPMEKPRGTAVSSSVRAEMIRPSRSRAADYATEKSRVTAVCSSVRAEMTRPSRSRAAKIMSPMRSRVVATRAPSCLGPLKITHPSRNRAAEIKAPSCVGLLKVMLDYRA